MSLINQMLKDLEARRAEGGSARPATLVRPHSSHLPWFVTGLLGVVVVLLGILLWQQGRQATTSPVVEQRDVIDADTQTEKHETGNEIADTAQVDIAAATSEPAVAEPAITEEDSTPGATMEPETTEPVARVEPEPVATVTKPVATSQRDTSRNTDPAEQESSFSIAPSSSDPRGQAQRNIERGLDAARRGEHRRAAEHLQAGLAILPREDEARLALHASLRRQGRIAEAEDVLETGLIEAREPYRFAAVLARLHAARGNVDDAVTLLKIDPPPVQENPEYHALWGALLQQLGDYSAALPVYERLAEHQPGNAQWLAGLGVARQQTGDEQGAVDAYRRALQTGRLADTLVDYIQGQLDRLALEEH